MSNHKFAEVLIAEDDVIMARLEKYNLQKTVLCTPVICNHGEEVMNYLEEREDPELPALVILDLNMPVMSGWDFLEELKTKPYSEKIYVVVVTSSIYKDDQNKAMSYDRVIGYFIKPLFKSHFKQIFELAEINNLFKPSLLPQQ